jgi:hypothetical protein
VNLSRLRGDSQCKFFASPDNRIYITAAESVNRKSANPANPSARRILDAPKTDVEG